MIMVQRKSSGFTLIELLAVVAIIVLGTSIVMMSLSRPINNQLETEANRIAALVNLAMQEAMLQSKELSIEFSTTGYSFFELEGQDWSAVEDSLLKARELPEGITLDLFIEGEQFDFGDDPEEQKPRVFLLSSGEITPFEIVLQADGSKERYKIAGDIRGKVNAPIKE